MHSTCFIGLYAGKGWTLPAERSVAHRLASEARGNIRQHTDAILIGATSDKCCLQTRCKPPTQGEAQAAEAKIHIQNDSFFCLFVFC